MSQESVQLENPKSVQGTDSIQCKARYIKSEEVCALAEKIWDEKKKGITCVDIQLQFKVKRGHAQRTLKQHNKKVLFTLSKPTSPQTYYPESRHADVIEYFKSKSVPVNPSGVEVQKSSPNNNPQQERLAREEQEAKVDNLVQALVMMSNTPMFIHKVFLELWVPSFLYEDVDAIPRSGNAQKVYSIPIGPAIVTYTLSRKGRLEISIECSEHPFPMASDADEQAFFVYIGKVQSNLQQWLSDPRERYIPSVMTWNLKRWDINWDPAITDKAQVTLPDIQLSYAGRVFRAYVKNLAGKAVYRGEEAVEEKPNTPLVEAITNLRNPNRQLEAKVEHLTALVEKLLVTKGATT